MEKEFFRSEIDRLLKLHNITVRRYSKSACGRAWSKTKEVIIPEPTDIEKFMVCLHEIRHIIQPKNIPSYFLEYDAETWSINYAKSLGLDTKPYEHRAKMYVIKCIAKGINRGLRVHGIHPEILKWLPVDITKWQDKKVYLYSKKRTYNDCNVKVLEKDKTTLISLYSSKWDETNEQTIFLEESK